MQGVQKVRKSSYSLYEYNAANVFIFTTLMSKGREDIAQHFLGKFLKYTPKGNRISIEI